MNILRSILLALVLASSSVSTFAAGTPAKLVVDCAAPRLLKMDDVGKLVGTYNFWQTYAVRDHLMSLAKARCKRGADFVQFVPGTEASAHEQGLTAATIPAQ
jgi:hypothetical protein